MTINEEQKKSRKKGGQGNKGRTSKKKTKKEDPKTSMKIDKKLIAGDLKNLGNRVLVNKNYKFPKDVDKDPLALTLKKILLDKI